MTWRLAMMVSGVALGVAAAALADDPWWSALGSRADANAAVSNPPAPTGRAPKDGTAAKTPAAPLTTATNVATPPAPVPKPNTATLPLAPSSNPARLQRKSAAQPLDWHALANMGASLAVVLVVLAAILWVLRRTAPKSASPLPKEAFEVLGRAPLAARQQAHLVRCGRKLLLVAMTPGGAETLTEITDPEEVDHLAGLCQASQNGSSSSAFQSVLQQFAQERITGADLGVDDGREVQRQEKRRYGARSTEVRHG